MYVSERCPSVHLLAPSPRLLLVSFVCALLVLVSTLALVLSRQPSDARPLHRQSHSRDILELRAAGSPSHSIHLLLYILTNIGSRTCAPLLENPVPVVRFLNYDTLPMCSSIDIDSWLVSRISPPTQCLAMPAPFSVPPESAHVVHSVDSGSPAPHAHR